MENGKGAVATGLRNGIGCGTTELHVIRLLGGISSLYLYRFLSQQSVRRDAKETFTSSAGQARVPTRFVEELELPLPTLAEQKRIVAKVEELLARVNAAREFLAKVPAILKRFRQSVLAAATSGELTEEWRQSALSAGSAKSELASRLAMSKDGGLLPRASEPIEGQELMIEGVPDSWATPKLTELFRFIDYRGKTPKKSQSGKRLISAKNIKMGYISEEPVEFVSDEFYRTWMTRGFPKKGDILFVTEGHTMGFAALNNRDDEFALSQRTIALQPWTSLETRCFFYFMMSPLFQDLVRANATGSAAVGIKAAKFRAFPIPYPPLPEQHEIVRQVDHLFSLADSIEKQMAAGTARAEKLTQAILAKAFRGDLVPQNPKDELVSELLKRIAAQRPRH